MLHLLLPIISYVIQILLEKLPDEDKMGDLLVDLCLMILEKAVASTQSDMDDQLLDQVKAAMKAA
tara:strand:+ start:182 stop:376 length:195 start_codon:yes stop_codon:yes gene_type:complete